MQEHTWLILLTVLVSANLALLGLLISALFSWRASLISLISELKKEFVESVEEVYTKKIADDTKIWNRLEHHLHNGEGRVVVGR